MRLFLLKNSYKSCLCLSVLNQYFENLEVLESLSLFKLGIAVTSVLLILQSPIHLMILEISMEIILLYFLVFYKHYATAGLKPNLLLYLKVRTILVFISDKSSI